MTSKFVSLLLDIDHLVVAGALATRPMSAQDVAEHCGRDLRTVLTCIGDLRASGCVVTDADGRFLIDGDVLRAAAVAFAEAEIPMDPVIGFGMTPDEQSVLERYFSGRTLVEFPRSRSKQLIVLQRVALEFDVGRRYTEAEVNELLLPFSTDWSMLRRHLVDEGFLDREPAAGGSRYWRSGGRVVDLPAR